MKIGLALSGGGILGFAHIGVLEELEKNNIKIDHICGTSAGSIVAAIYASGGVKALNEFAQAITKLEYFGEKRPLKIVTPARLFEQIGSLVEQFTAERIEDTKTKLSIVATDVCKGDEKIFRKGSTKKAVMASCAYPGVFPYQEVDGKYYIDGGLTRNLPVDMLYDCDYKIGSNLYSIGEISEERVKKMNRINILSRTIDIFQKELAEIFVEKCDFCFDIHSGSLKWYSFNKIKEAREAGREQARKQVKKLTKLLQEQV